ncbi:hypothetical protein Tco_0080534 [Tanacetum coccineum]
MGGSSSQSQPSQPPRSSINAFSLEELYTPDFSENTDYWQEPNPYEATGEQVATSPTKKKKATRNRQKRLTQTDDAPRQIAWTTEEEIALAKGWKVVSENSERGNAKKKDGFWVEVMEYMESKTKMKGRRTYDMESGVEDEDYVQKGSNKRHKSFGSSSFNTESGDASINLNNIIAGDDEVVADDDEVLEIQRPVGRDKARAAAKNKRSKASASSTMNDDALLEIVATKYRAQQEDMKLYLQPYGHLTGEKRLAWEEIRAKIRAKYNLQF